MPLNDSHPYPFIYFQSEQETPLGQSMDLVLSILGSMHPTPRPAQGRGGGGGGELFSDHDLSYINNSVILKPFLCNALACQDCMLQLS